MTHPRTFIADLGGKLGAEVVIAGWARALRTTKSTTFLVLSDGSGTVQVVAEPKLLANVQREDALRLRSFRKGEETTKVRDGGFCQPSAIWAFETAISPSP